MQGFFAEHETQSETPLVISSVPKCGACGLRAGCSSPQMEPMIRRGSKILFVHSNPESEEDANDNPEHGEWFHWLRRIACDVDEDLDPTNHDIAHAVACWPGKAKISRENSTHCLAHRIHSVRQSECLVIVPMGELAIHSMLSPFLGSIGEWDRYTGHIIPTEEFTICPIDDPVLCKDSKNPARTVTMQRHLENILLNAVDRTPARLNVDHIKNCWTYSTRDAEDFIKDMTSIKRPVAFDYETNCLKPDHPDAFVASVALSDGQHTLAFPWDEKLEDPWKRFLKSDTPKIAANLKMEERWSAAKFGQPAAAWDWDTMLAAHILDNRKKTKGLKFQAFVRLGVLPYDKKIEPFLRSDDDNIFNRINDCPMPELLIYNAMDAYLEWRLAELQKKDLDA